MTTSRRFFDWSLRRPRRHGVTLVLTAAPLAILLAWFYGNLLVSEIEIDFNGATAPAQVVRIEEASRGPSQAMVEFSAKNGTVKTWVYLSKSPQRTLPGAIIQVEYAKNDPLRARHAGTHDLLEQVYPFLIAIIAVVVFIGVIAIPTLVGRLLRLIARLGAKFFQDGQRRTSRH